MLKSLIRSSPGPCLYELIIQVQGSGDRSSPCRRHPGLGQVLRRPLRLLERPRADGDAGKVRPDEPRVENFQLQRHRRRRREVEPNFLKGMGPKSSKVLNLFLL